MGGTVITLQRPGECKQCGADLPVGAEARYYGRHGMYGLDCHEDQRPSRRRAGSRRPVDGSEGALRSFHDPEGVYAQDGTYLGKAGPRCEDAPCCGCCP